MKTRCSYCGYEANFHQTLNKEINPRDGDVSFCISCGEFSQFRNLMRIKIDSIPDELQQECNKVRDSWIRTRTMAKIIKDRTKKDELL